MVVREAVENRITFWNREAEAVYGYTGDEATVQVTHDLLATVFPESREVLNQALAQDGHWEGVRLHTRQDGG
ncbi:MAG: PAS domain-containing protein [Solirubrobacteraceae bacterium]